VRRVDYAYAYPQTATASDGSISIVNLYQQSGSAAVPQGMPQLDINEAVAQCNNLLAAALVKQAMKDGYAPT
jgi:hypothetical protein